MENTNKDDNSLQDPNTPNANNRVDELVKYAEPNSLARANSYNNKPIIHQDPQASNLDSVGDTAKSLAIGAGSIANSTLAWVHQHNLDLSSLPGGQVLQTLYNQNQGQKENDTGTSVFSHIDNFLGGEQAEVDADNPNPYIYYTGKIAGSMLAFALGGEALGAAKGVSLAYNAAKGTKLATNAVESIAPELTAKETAEGIIANSKSVQSAIYNTKDGMARQAIYQNIVGLPIAFGSSLHFDKHGQVSADVPEFLMNTALNGVMSGIFAGVGKTYSTLALKRSQVTSAGSKARELAEETRSKTEVNTVKPLQNTPIEDTKHYTEAEKIVNDNVSNAVGNEKLIEATFSDDQKKQIINDVLGKKRISGETYSDIKLSKKASVDYHKIMTDSSLSDISKTKVIRALLSKHGILHQDKNISLDRVTDVEPLKIQMKQIDRFYKESGQRKVLLTDEYRKLPFNEKADILAKSLFKTNPYANTGAIKYLEKHGYYIDKPYENGSKILHDYPNWYMQHKSGVEDPKLLKELDSMVASGSKHGIYLKGLLEASHKDHVDGHRQGLFKSIRSTIDNHTNEEEANQVLNDYHNSEGMFGHQSFAEEEKKLTDHVMEELEKDKPKFYDDDAENIYYTKVLRKLEDNSKYAESYFLCMLNFMK
tara:strand:+ start:1331 stop:3283 length:1953 start_codon:yes stop_codon:yes gene_type:complete